MSAEVWDKISSHFSTSSLVSNSYCHIEKEIKFKSIDILLKDKISHNVFNKNKTFTHLFRKYSEFTMKQNKSYGKYKIIFTYDYFSNFFKFNKIGRYKFFLNINFIYKPFFKKNLNFCTNLYYFYETEILTRWNFYKDLDFMTSKIFFEYSKPLQDVSSYFFSFYRNLLLFYSKSLEKSSTIMRKKKLKYWISTSPRRIFEEIKCKINYFSYPINFLVIILRLIPNINRGLLVNNFSRSLLLKPFLTEGTYFLHVSLINQCKKSYNIKEILNKIPTRKTKNLFGQFSEFLIQKKFYQEFIFHSLKQFTSSKNFFGNLLIIFKCFIKIQDKYQTIRPSLLLCNLIIVFKESFDLILKFDYFIQTEIKYSPINCKVIDKDIFTSVAKKEKRNYESLFLFFFGAAKILGYPTYLKILSIKIFTDAMKKSYYSIKSVLIELILCLTKKTSSFLVQKSKYKKIIRKFQKHCESILRKCNIVRLKYIYQKKKTYLISH